MLPARAGKGDSMIKDWMVQGFFVTPMELSLRAYDPASG